MASIPGTFIEAAEAMQRPNDPEATGEALWRFSLAFYARPGVAAALLALQDRAGRDINLILWALWAGIVGCRRLDAADVAAAEAAAAPLYAAVVELLRRLRRQLSADPHADIQDLRRRVAAVELMAERRLQNRLARLLDGGGQAVAPADRRAAAEANLALYLGSGSTEATLLGEALAAFPLRR
jgi:uncharacterized protein (TIGR02444 family)